MHPHEQQLIIAGYLTKRFTPWHFQVKRKGKKGIINVWPTARKVLKEYEPGPAPHYTDIVAAVAAIFQPVMMPPQTLDELNWADLLAWFRADPLERLEEYAKWGERLMV